MKVSVTHAKNRQNRRRRGQNRQLVRLSADRTLRLISMAIWTLVAGCLVLAGVLWGLLLN